MPKTTSFSILILGKKDFLLEKTILSIAYQTLADIQVILQKYHEGKIGNLAKKYNNVHFYFTDPNKSNFPE